MTRPATRLAALFLPLLLLVSPAQAQQRQATGRAALDTFGRATDTAFNAGALGAMVKIRGEENPRQYGLAADHVALEVVSVERGTPGQKAGLAVGDLIVGIDDAVLGLDEDPLYVLAGAMIARYSGAVAGPIKLKIVRRGTAGQLRVTFRSYGKNWEATLRRQSMSRLLGMSTSAAKMGGNNAKVAINAVCGLAVLANGLAPGRASKYKSAVMGAAGVEARWGGGGGAKGGANHSQVNWSLGYATVFLAEFCKRTGDGGVRSKLAKLCRMIEKNQETNGGFAHGPGGPNSLGYTDLGVVSVLCMAGYGASGQCGVKLNPATTKKGIDYLIGTSNGDGGIGYSQRSGQKGLADPGKTCGGFMVFTAHKKQSDPFYFKMMEYLMNNLNMVFEGHASPMVHLQLSAIGYSMFQGGWQIFHDKFAKEILLGRKYDGSFHPRPSAESKSGLNSDASMGPAWSTASYLLAWSMAGSKLKIFNK